MSKNPKVRGQARLEQIKRMLQLVLRYGWRLRVRVLIVLILGIFLAASSKAPIILVSQIIRKVFIDPGSSFAPKEKTAEEKAKDKFSLLDAKFLDDLENKTLGMLGIKTDLTGTPTEQLVTIKRNTLVAVGILASVLALIAGLTMYFFFKLSHYLALRVVVSLRVDLCRHLLSLGLSFFARRKLGDLISRVSNDTMIALRTFTLIFENLLIEPLYLLATLVVVIWALQSFWLALLLLLGVPIMGLPIYHLGRKVRRGSKKSLTSMADSVESMSQMFSGVRTVQAFQAEQREIESFNKVNAQFLKRTMGMIKAKAASQGSTSFIFQVAFTAGIVGLGWFSVDPEARIMEADRMGVLVAVLVPCYTHVKRLTRTYTLIMESLAAIERIYELLDTPAEIQDHPEQRELPAIQGNVEFKDVSFAYEEDMVLEKVNFSCRAGQTVAFVGPSGAGKSTMMDLIARFYDPTSGQVLVDGTDLQAAKVSTYRPHMALVSQDPFLFNASIFENIRYGKPDAERLAVEAAARAAQIHDFIMTLPAGYETVVGERGTRLSGGQLQRITIARAILKGATIMLLDEATSSLDSESEREVQRALDNLMAGKTCFVIAHRLSTVRDADLILALENGRLVEQGTHADLLAKGGLYKRLHDVQFKKEAD